MAQPVLPKNPTEWYKQFTALFQPIGIDHKLRAQDVFGTHPSGSHATYHTTLNYRNLWKIAEGETENHAFVHHHLLWDTKLQADVSKKVKPLIKPLLQALHERSGKSLTRKDVRTIRTEAPAFAPFVENLWQIDNTLVQEAVEPDTSISINKSAADKILQITPFTVERSAEIRRRLNNLGSGSGLGLGLKARSTSDIRTPTKAGGTGGNWRNLGHLEDSEGSDNEYDSPQLEESSPNINQKQYSLRAPNRLAYVPPKRTTLDYHRREPVPAHRTAKCETNITHTAIPLLQDMAIHVSPSSPSKPFSSIFSKDDTMLAAHVYETLVSPENRRFIFYGGELGGCVKLWEARTDGAVLMKISPEEPDCTVPGGNPTGGMSESTSQTANDIFLEEFVGGIIEAKNTKRTDVVRYQEGAEVVAFIRETSMNQKRSPRFTYVLSFCGSYGYITIATWGKRYEEYLQTISEGKKNPRGQLIGFASEELIGELFDIDEFVVFTEYGPFPLDCAGSLQKLLLNVVLLMELPVSVLDKGQNDSEDPRPDIQGSKNSKAAFRKPSQT